MHAATRSALILGILAVVGVWIAATGGHRVGQQETSSLGSTEVAMDVATEPVTRPQRTSRVVHDDDDNPLLSAGDRSSTRRSWSDLRGDDQIVVRAVAALRAVIVRNLPPPSSLADGEQASTTTDQAGIVQHARKASERRAYHLVVRHLLYRRHPRPLDPIEASTAKGEERSVQDDGDDSGVVLMELLCLKWHSVGLVGLHRNATYDCRNRQHTCRTDDATNVGCGAIEDWASQHCRWSNGSYDDQGTHMSASFTGAVVEEVRKRILQYHYVVNEVLPHASMDGSCSDKDAPPPTGSVPEGPSTARAALSALVDVDHAISYVLQRAFHIAMPSQGLLCLVPKLRALLAFGRTHRWMFDAKGSRRHHPLVVASVDDVVDVLRDEVDHHRQQSNGAQSPGSGGRDDKEHKHYKFGYHFNFPDKKAAGRPSARAKPIFFNLSNVIIPSTVPASGRGGGMQLSGIGVPGGYKKFDRLRDERFIPIRRLGVVERSSVAPPPRFVVRRTRPLYLFPVLFGSDNIGHVMFRYYSALHLMSSSLGGLAPRDAMVGYVVLPSAGSTFRPSANMHRAWYDAFGPSWFGLLPGETMPSPPTASSTTPQSMDGGGSANQTMRHPLSPPLRNDRNATTTAAVVVDGALDILFEHVVVGFGATYMFHPRHIGNIDAERLKSQEALVPVLHTARNMLLQCFGWQRNSSSLYNATAPLLQPLGGVDGAMRITMILRTSRQLENAEALVAQLEAEIGVGNLTSVLRGRRVLIRTVRLEHLSIRDQVALAMATDVLIGVAGSGLSWMMFMPPWRVVVEVQDPPIMRCTGVGINQERTYCDFSKQSAAAHLHHIGIPAAKANPHDCASNALRCSLKLSYEVFAGTVAAAMCTVGIADPAAAHSTCNKYFPVV